jgi:hypothetical protein
MSTSVEVPARVEQAAAEQRLGPLVGATKGSNPFANFLFALLVSAAILGVTLGAASLGFGGRAVRSILLFAFAISVLWLFFAVVGLFSGFRRFYLFAGGVVRWQNGRVRAVPWSQVTAVTRLRAGKTCSGYELHLAGGRKLVVEAVETIDAGREFGLLIEEAAGRAGYQVTG